MMLMNSCCTWEVQYAEIAFGEGWINPIWSLFWKLVQHILEVSRLSSSILLVSVLAKKCCNLVQATNLPKTWRIWLAWYFPHSTRISLVPQRPRILWLKTKAIGEISDSDFHHCPVNCHSHRFTESGIRSNTRGAGQRWIFRFTEL
jgi:hypothetical protein